MSSDRTWRIAFTLGALLVCRIRRHIPLAVIFGIASRVREGARASY